MGGFGGFGTFFFSEWLLGGLREVISGGLKALKLSSELVYFFWREKTNISIKISIFQGMGVRKAKKSEQISIFY